jgi:hypothetical protein
MKGELKPIGEKNATQLADKKFSVVIGTPKVFERGGKILRQTKEVSNNVETNVNKTKTNVEMNMENLTKFQVNPEMVRCF